MYQQDADQSTRYVQLYAGPTTQARPSASVANARLAALVLLVAIAVGVSECGSLARAGLPTRQIMSRWRLR